MQQDVVDLGRFARMLMVGVYGDNLIAFRLLNDAKALSLFVGTSETIV